LDQWLINSFCFSCDIILQKHTQQKN